MRYKHGVKSGGTGNKDRFGSSNWFSFFTARVVLYPSHLLAHDTVRRWTVREYESRDQTVCDLLLLPQSYGRL